FFVGASTTAVGYLPIDVGNSDANDLRIVTTGGYTLSGHITIEGRSARESEGDLSRMTVGLTRDPDIIEMPGALLQLPPPPPGTPRPAGLTEIRNQNGLVTAMGDFKMLVSPGDFRVNIDRLPANTYVKTIRMGGDDLLRSGLHVSRASEENI